MNSIILQGINTEDLKEIFREVLDEKIKQKSDPKDLGRKLPYLNRFEVAEILKISLPTLNNWSKSGIVQSYRIGNRVLYKAEEIDKAIQEVKSIKYKRG